VHDLRHGAAFVRDINGHIVLENHDRLRVTIRISRPRQVA
jgi:hypothetical protein